MTSVVQKSNKFTTFSFQILKLSHRPKLIIQKLQTGNTKHHSDLKKNNNSLLFPYFQFQPIFVSFA